MPENPFAGATRDPIQLLEQLIGQVANLKRDFDQTSQELKQDVRQLVQDVSHLKQDVSHLKTRLDRIETEVSSLRAETSGIRGDLVRFVSAFDKEQNAVRQQMEVAVDRKTWLVRNEWQERYAELEQRIAVLEEAERRRLEEKGA